MTVNQWEAQGVSAKGQQQGTESDASEGNIRCSRGLTQIEDFDTRPHLERLSQHVRANLSVPAMCKERPTALDVLSESGSGITAISEALLEEIQAGVPGIQLTRPFEGKTIVATATCEEQNAEDQPSRYTQPSSPHGGQSGLRYLSSCFLGLVPWL